MIAAATPRTLWIELTSKCPIDCVFCSRKTRRGAGEHMPYAVFESVLAQLDAPRILRLNYSGESTTYPELIPAIRSARSTGAFVELVSALVNVPLAALPEICGSGLNRLTVSVHTTDAERFAAIYRYGSFEGLRSRLAEVMERRRERTPQLLVDFAFVAMDANLGDLAGVGGLAQSLGVRAIQVFPVIRRDEIPVSFPAELEHSGGHRRDFRQRVKSTVEAAATQYPEVSFQISNPWFSRETAEIGEVPVAFPGPLAAGASIHSCDQNPWETAHILSSGDMVPCEVLDRVSLGNVQQQSLAEIWHGEAYTQFRERYHRGEIPECRVCPWKRAYRAGPLKPEILAARGASAQLLHGWHEQQGEAHVWASQAAAAVISPRSGSRSLHVSGSLPPGVNGETNELAVTCNGTEIGRVTNPWNETMPFGLDFPVTPSQGTPWFLEFRTRAVYRPSERECWPDQRDLGFALVLLASKAPVSDEVEVRRRAASLRGLATLVRATDAGGAFLRPILRRRRARPRPFAPGVSIVVPERENPVELAACLAGVREAAAQWKEPLETIVVVNGSSQSEYAALRARYPEVQWDFTRRPLGFSAAVARGLDLARFDWVYLLNSDAAPDCAAIIEAGRHRAPGVFSIASQIVFKDRTRFREETNWTKLFMEDGLAAAHDRIPQSDETVEGFYAGGGASLFQKRLLRRFARASAYEPFYWEDVEWGWRARKAGYTSLFCPRSLVHHTQRATIGRHYGAEEIESVLQRNRLLFQLRNVTGAGSLDKVWEAAAAASPEVSRGLLRLSTAGGIVRGRFWNYFAPIADNELL